MLLLHVITLALVLSYGCAQIHLRQAQLSITRAKDKTARIVCEASGIQNFRDAVIHWYRHRPGEAPERILYISSGQPVFDKDSDKKKFKCDKQADQLISTLTVNEIAPNDGATYYCAYWDLTVGYYIKVFGSGTKLIVTDIKAKFNSTTMKILPPSTEQDGKVSYMCLIQDFYPNVIKVTWEDENKNEEKNGVHEEIWIHRDNESYSLSSWLTVDKNSGKNYSCKYQHEIQNNYVPVESPDKPVVTQTTGSCISKPENGTTLSTDTTDSFTHRTASLIYIVLLLKSTMYYVIVLFFIYRMQSPIKRRGKKP
ncbi:immunoglobulin kappa light chain-like isoform 3-T3 [Pangshura tecta]